MMNNFLFLLLIIPAAFLLYVLLLEILRIRYIYKLMFLFKGAKWQNFPIVSLAIMGRLASISYKILGSAGESIFMWRKFFCDVNGGIYFAYHWKLTYNLIQQTENFPLTPNHLIITDPNLVEQILQDCLGESTKDDGFKRN